MWPVPGDSQWLLMPDGRPVEQWVTYCDRRRCITVTPVDSRSLHGIAVAVPVLTCYDYDSPFIAVVFVVDDFFGDTTRCNCRCYSTYYWCYMRLLGIVQTCLPVTVLFLFDLIDSILRCDVIPWWLLRWWSSVFHLIEPGTTTTFLITVDCLVRCVPLFDTLIILFIPVITLLPVFPADFYIVLTAVVLFSLPLYH